LAFFRSGFRLCGTLWTNLREADKSPHKSPHWTSLVRVRLKTRPQARADRHHERPATFKSILLSSNVPRSPYGKVRPLHGILSSSFERRPNGPHIFVIGAVSAS